MPSGIGQSTSDGKPYLVDDAFPEIGKSVQTGRRGCFYGQIRVKYPLPYQRRPTDGIPASETRNHRTYDKNENLFRRMMRRKHQWWCCRLFFVNLIFYKTMATLMINKSGKTAGYNVQFPFEKPEF